MTCHLYFIGKGGIVFVKTDNREPIQGPTEHYELYEEMTDP